MEKGTAKNVTGEVRRSWLYRFWHEWFMPHYRKWKRHYHVGFGSSFVLGIMAGLSVNHLPIVGTNFQVEGVERFSYTQGGTTATLYHVSYERKPEVQGNTEISKVISHGPVREIEKQAVPSYEGAGLMFRYRYWWEWWLYVIPIPHSKVVIVGRSLEEIDKRMK